jgi:hypothetical protein
LKHRSRFLKEFSMRIGHRFLAVALLIVGVAGCGQYVGTGPTTTTTSTAAPDSRLLLSEAPAGAKTVIETRQAAKDGEEVTITGRIGGSTDPWVKGRATFFIVDPTLVPCSEREGDSCPTPWDYCCDSDRLAESMATIKFVDDQGQTIATDARDLLGVKELQRVTVRGRAKRDEAGNLTVLASGIHIQP